MPRPRKSLAYYDGKAYRDIEHQLRKERLPESIVVDTIAEIRAFRKERTASKARARESAKQWGEIVSALQHERKIVRSMVRYKTQDPAPEREEFVTAYMAVLDNLYKRLSTKRKQAADLPEKGKDHWSDYIPVHIKTAIVAAAANIPRRDRERVKTPFERKLPLDLSALRRGRLYRKTRTLLDDAVRTLIPNPSDEKLQERVRNLRQALDKINALEPNAHVPDTWTELG